MVVVALTILPTYLPTDLLTRLITQEQNHPIYLRSQLHQHLRGREVLDLEFERERVDGVPRLSGR